MNTFVSNNDKPAYRPTLPAAYPRSDFPKLKSMSYDRPVHSFSFPKAQQSYVSFVALMRSMDLSPLKDQMEDNEYCFFDIDDLLNFMVSSSTDFLATNKLYFLCGDYEFEDVLNSITDNADSILSKIKSFISDFSIQLEIINISFMSVITRGHLLYGCHVSKSLMNNHWIMMLAANNHDLYQEHISLVEYHSNAFLVKEKTAPHFNKDIDPSISIQVISEAECYEEYLAQHSLYYRNLNLLGEECTSKESALLPARVLA